VQASVQKSLKILDGPGESIMRCIKRMPILFFDNTAAMADERNKTQ
jgi:hypothetical protein